MKKYFLLATAALVMNTQLATADDNAAVDYYVNLTQTDTMFSLQSLSFGTILLNTLTPSGYVTISSGGNQSSSMDESTGNIVDWRGDIHTGTVCINSSSGITIDVSELTEQDISSGITVKAFEQDGGNQLDIQGGSGGASYTCYQIGATLAFDGESTVSTGPISTSVTISAVE